MASFSGNSVLGVAGVERSEPPGERAGGSLRLTTSHPLNCQENLPHTLMNDFLTHGGNLTTFGEKDIHIV